MKKTTEKTKAVTEQKNQSQEKQHTQSKLHVCWSEKNNDMNKTVIISIPQYIASYILKTFGENTISCQYMGIDQSGRILFELNYEQGKEKLIQELNSNIEESEQAINLIAQVINVAMEEAIEKCKTSLDVPRRKRKY